MNKVLHSANPAPAEQRPGRMLGGHRLVRALGKGGLGEVFQAVAPDGSTVAVKAFAIRDDDLGLMAEAFVREANLGQRLEHPNIVKVLSSGCEGAYAFLVMEFVAGQDLRVHTQPDRLLPLAHVLWVAQGVAQALEAAHAMKVVHRDIKPGNVLVDWQNQVVKVTDFGLARLGDSFRSRTGVMAGTPSYMSPEQLAESAVGPASDLYSLGVLMFELLTGRLPHEASSLGALLDRAANHVAPRVSTLRAGLPAALTTLIAELLERRSERRPPDAAAVISRLAALQAVVQADDTAAAAGPKSRG